MADNSLLSLDLRGETMMGKEKPKRRSIASAVKAFSASAYSLGTFSKQEDGNPLMAPPSHQDIYDEAEINEWSMDDYTPCASRSPSYPVFDMDKKRSTSEYELRKHQTVYCVSTIICCICLVIGAVIGRFIMPWGCDNCLGEKRNEQKWIRIFANDISRYSPRYPSNNSIPKRFISDFEEFGFTKVNHEDLNYMKYKISEARINYSDYVFVMTVIGHNLKDHNIDYTGIWIHLSRCSNLSHIFLDHPSIIYCHLEGKFKKRWLDNPNIKLLLVSGSNDKSDIIWHTKLNVPVIMITPIAPLDNNPRTVTVEVKVTKATEPGTVVTGIVEGVESPDKYVIVGAMMLDPVGVNLLLSSAFSMSQLTKKGWKPVRSIIFVIFQNFEIADHWLELHNTLLSFRTEGVVAFDDPLNGIDSFYGQGSSVFRQLLYSSTNKIQEKDNHPFSLKERWRMCFPQELLNVNYTLPRLGNLHPYSLGYKFKQTLGAPTVDLGFKNSEEKKCLSTTPMLTRNESLRKLQDLSGFIILQLVNSNLIPYNVIDVGKDIDKYVNNIKISGNDKLMSTEKGNILRKLRIFQDHASRFHTYIDLSLNIANKLKVWKLTERILLTNKCVSNINCLSNDSEPTGTNASELQQVLSKIKNSVDCSISALTGGTSFI